MVGRRTFWRRWGVRGLKVLAWAPALLLLLFVALQLLLQTPWLRGMVESRISQRLNGLEVHVTDLDWTPWTGGSLHGLRIEQPSEFQELSSQPLLKVRQVHVQPDYLALFKGKRRLKELRVVEPQMQVIAELLVVLATQGVAPPGPPPVVAQVDPAVIQPPREAASVEAPAPPAEPEVSAVASRDKVPPASGGEKVPPAAEPLQAKDVVREPTRVSVEGGRFELVRAGKEGRLALIDGVAFDLPVFGEPSKSTIEVAVVEGLGLDLGKALEVEVETRGSELMMWLPDRSLISGKLALGLVGGLPFHLELGIDEVALDEGLELFGAKVEGGAISAGCEGGGWLQALWSWNGVGEVRVAPVVVSMGAERAEFDELKGTASLSSGRFHLPEFRMIGESGAVLGNGWLTANDGAVVSRLVMPSELAGVLNQRLVQAIPEGVLAFRALEAGERYYADVSLWRRPDGWWVQLGEGGSEFPLRELFAEKD